MSNDENKFQPIFQILHLKSAWFLLELAMALDTTIGMRFLQVWQLLPARDHQGIFNCLSNVLGEAYHASRLLCGHMITYAMCCCSGNNTTAVMKFSLKCSNNAAWCAVVILCKGSPSTCIHKWQYTVGWNQFWPVHYIIPMLKQEISIILINTEGRH